MPPADRDRAHTGRQGGPRLPRCDAVCHDSTRRRHHRSTNNAQVVGDA